jgi:hypothetical protein
MLQKNQAKKADKDERVKLVVSVQPDSKSAPSRAGVGLIPADQPT